MEKEPHNEAANEEAFQGEEDDDLGYYPDGVKRTLTDDQIAMFRHSEIYSILRERQVRKENLEADGGDIPDDMTSRPEEAIEATMLSDEEGEVLSDGEVKEVSVTVPQDTREYEQDMHARKKQKREDTNGDYVHGKKHASRSARGFVRELDSAVAQDQILDYDDEPTAADGAKDNNAQITHAEGQDREGQARPAEGKKIWWPIIEAP